MFDADEGQNRGLRRPIWIMLAALGIVMISGFIAGFTAQHQSEGGGAFTGIAAAILAAAILAIIGLGYWAWQNAKAMKVPGENLTRRELLNHNILLGCVFLGGVMGFAIAASGISNTSDNAADPFAALIAGPLPLHILVPIIIVWGIIMPVIAWFWHTRIIDEQEANAYRDGGYYAAYAFLLLTPLWWLLWRGGFLPEPDGVAIYITFSLVWTAVWFWKKYL